MRRNWLVSLIGSKLITTILPSGFRKVVFSELNDKIDVAKAN